jgi:tRNA threonylcarbamoyladenosine biosynthesis protein TsaB
MNPTGTLLGIETSGRRTALALVRDDRPVANRTHNGMDHDEVLPGMLSDLLNDAGTDISKVTGIGVSHGPGMFTALRVGLAWAAALAISRNIPVRGVSTLEVLAAGTATAEPVLALLDARKGQFYAGIYCAGSTLLPAGLYQPEALTATIATLLPTARRLPVAGDGVKPAMPHLERFNPVPTGILLPDAVQVARIAARQLATVGPDDPATLAPAYLRRTDAELSRRRSGRP